MIAFGLPFLFALITAYAALPEHGSAASEDRSGGAAETASFTGADFPREYSPRLVSLEEGDDADKDPFRGGAQHRLERSLYRDPQSRDRIVSFYAEIVGSRALAAIILEEAYLHEVPFSLAVSLAYVESSFDPRAVNVNFSSVDRGLFQLNNRSFPAMSEAEFFDPQTNAEKGIAYLRWCYEHGGNEIAALAMYNAGRRRVNERGAPKMTLDHIAKILDYRSRIEERFASAFPGEAKRSAAAGFPPAESGAEVAKAVDSSPQAQ